jgi:A/G-specific adenine glycosylase
VVSAGKAQSQGDLRNDALLAWYQDHRRRLPWRQTTDPYRILVSEIMLQQTQVGRVIPRYGRFLERFPTAAALAAAAPAEVIAEWNGLGYNLRARRLWEAAREVAAGGWPDDVAGLRRLPGVGPYTAAAVACLAFGRPVAAVDTNLRRVLSRWAGRALDGADLREEAAAAIDPDAPADWNQAVMDLGATRCRPRAPRCGDCPVARWCTDPTVEVAPAAQPPFEGSRRQARGAVIRHLSTSGPATLDRLAEATGLARLRIADAVDSLQADGMLAADGSRLRIA